MRLDVAIKAREIIPLVYRVTSRFPRSEDRVLTAQMRRAAHSIGANLAEGAGRSSAGEFALFVGYATGSAYELEWHSVSSDQLGYLAPEDKEQLLSRVTDLKKLLYRFRESILHPRHHP